MRALVLMMVIFFITTLSDFTAIAPTLTVVQPSADKSIVPKWYTLTPVFVKLPHWFTLFQYFLQILSGKYGGLSYGGHGIIIFIQR